MFEKENQRHLLLLLSEQMMVMFAMIVTTHSSLGPESSILCADRFCLSVNDPLHQTTEVLQSHPHPRPLGISGH